MTEYASNKMTIADAVSGEGLLVVAQWEANEGQADNVATSSIASCLKRKVSPA